MTWDGLSNDELWDAYEASCIARDRQGSERGVSVRASAIVLARQVGSRSGSRPRRGSWSMANVLA